MRMSLDRVDEMKPRLSSDFVSTQGAFQAIGDRGACQPLPRALIQMAPCEWTRNSAAAQLTRPKMQTAPVAELLQQCRTALADPNRL